MPKKDSGGGPEAAVKWKEVDVDLSPELELPTVIDDEVAAYKSLEVVQADINQAVLSWFNIYHSLVWIVAATDHPKTNPLDWQMLGSVPCSVSGPMGSGFCLTESHRVPAFYPVEVGADNQSGWIYGGANDKYLELIQSLTFGKRFVREILQKISIDNESSQPVLQYFLQRLNGLPADFDWQDCINNCHNLIFGNSHLHTNTFFDAALALLEGIWLKPDGTAEDVVEIQNHLNEMQVWLNTVDVDDPAAFEAWLVESLLQVATFQGDNFDDRVKLVFENGSSEAKTVITEQTVMLHINMSLFDLIYHRFVDQDNDATSKGLEEAFPVLTDNMDWLNLLQAAYGALAWQIARQAQQAADAVRQVL